MQNREKKVWQRPIHKLMPFEITADNHEISNNKPVNDSKSADETRILNGRITTPKAKEEEQYLRELQDRHG